MKGLRGAIFTLPSVLVVFGTLTASMPACSSSDGAFTTKDDGVFDTRDGGKPDAEAGPECPGLHCSRDLKTVLTGCEGAEQVVQECGESQACGNGMCLAACEAAKLSKGSMGCEFWTVPPDDVENNIGDCFVAMIANTWNTPVNVAAQLGEESLDISQSIYTAHKENVTTTYTKLEGPLPVGEVGLVFLSQADDFGGGKGTKCPSGVTPAFHADPMKHGTALTRAFRITTDAPVSAYSIFPYGGAKSYQPTATLLLPTSSWGTNYIAVSTSRVVTKGGPEGPAGFRTLQIVASEDDTVVRMRPNTDVSGGQGVTAGARGVVQSWTLSRGQVLQLNQYTGLTGSPIETTKPVGMFGGAECSYIPAGFQACDLTQQQIAPLEEWGSEYALVPYRPRTEIPGGRENVPWTLVGAVDGTVLKYDPERPVGAPETLAAGQAVTFLTDQIVSVHSQGNDHPFHAAVYMTGTLFTSSGGGAGGDPDFVTMVPSDQFLDHYVFFTDFTFAETSLAVVRRKTAGGFAPVTLDCAGELGDWQPIGADGNYEFTWVRLTHGHLPQTFGGGTCGYGRHEANSEGPFTLSVWGTDDAASYGYPGGTGLRPITTVRIPLN